MDETSVSMQHWRVDHDYTNTLGMEITKGRNFSLDFPSDSSAIIINERAAKLFGFDDPIGKNIVMMNREREEIGYTIIGVVANFHFQSMKENIDALSFVLGDSRGFALFKINTSDIQNTIVRVEQNWNELAPDQPFVYTVLDVEYNDMYQAEQKIGTIFTSFALLAIFIACLGLFALSAYTAEQRTKEIGVRKVLGASVQSVVLLLSKEFVKLILIAFIIAAPLAWWGIDAWLSTYTYRTNIGFEVFLLAGLVAFLIAWLTMSYQSIRAAMSNPVNSLRSE
jgi:putative ABC transport system permease protein